MNGDFSIHDPFIDGEGNSLWVDNFGDEGIYLIVRSEDGREIRVDVDRINSRMLAERIAE